MSSTVRSADAAPKCVWTSMTGKRARVRVSALAGAVAALVPAAVPGGAAAAAVAPAAVPAAVPVPAPPPPPEQAATSPSTPMTAARIRPFRHTRARESTAPRVEWAVVSTRIGCRS